MEAPKRVLCLMDYAPLGRAALVPALQTLAACGVQACGLPTALLSTHLGGFGAPATLDAEGFCEAALGHYEREGTQFDAVYTGYLMSEAQFALAGRAFGLWPDALKLVDPVLGDSGKVYSKTTDGMIRAMGALCAEADIITPNPTELALLAGLPADAGMGTATTEKALATLHKNTPAIVVTSAVLHGGGTGLLLSDKEAEIPSEIPLNLAPIGYPGTGDLFAAALCGLLLRELSLKDAAATAAHFVGSAVFATYEGGGEARQGVWFEPLLPLLAKAVAGSA